MGYTARKTKEHFKKEIKTWKPDNCPCSHSEYFYVGTCLLELYVSRQEKGLCDPIGGTAKQKADFAVKNNKAIIQDAQDFYKWAKEAEGTSLIEFTFLSTQEHENASSFVSLVVLLKLRKVQ